MERPGKEIRDDGQPDLGSTEEFWHWLASLTDEDPLTFEEAATMARMKPDSFRYLVYHGKDGPQGFRLGKKRVFRKGAIRKWIKDAEDLQRGAA